MSSSKDLHGPLVQVAVPIPLHQALTYSVPENLTCLASPGVRVRVQVARKRMVGVIVSEEQKAPEGVNLRPILEVLDRDPVLGPELLKLTTTLSEYYMAPPGEVVRVMLPPELSSWGDSRVKITNAGALMAPAEGLEARIVEALRDGGSRRVGELAAQVGGEGFASAVDRLQAAARLELTSTGRGTRSRYQSAVELAQGDLEHLLERCGRSKPGREVVSYLAALGRPAVLSEITAAVSCSTAVIRRLIKLGVLRSFTQVSRLSLDDHLLGASQQESPFELRPDQEEVVTTLLGALERRKFGAYLLAGITGSGKTEVYLRAAESVLREGGSVIVLVPEIALVPALARAARDRFGTLTAILHSAMSGSERHQEWERIRAGEARLVLGPRSAVFSPVRNLRLIVVDEEQDPSYKQDQVPRYHGRDVSLLRAYQEGAVVALVSATPSLEARHNLEVGKLVSLRLTERVGQGALPDGILVDLRQEGLSRQPGEIHFSQRLREEIDASLGAGDQIILLRNRRGYSPVLLCRACGEDMRCDDCGLPRTFHRREAVLRCHYCGSRLPVPTSCPSCGEEALEAIGAGTERVEETFQELFPNVSVGVLDRDASRRRGEAAAVLERFANGETQVLIGTQMVSKGHHFPRVALAGVLLADTYLGFPDFRAVERTYNLLTQLAGRAGRGERPGKVVIQTYHPEHYAIQAALNHDDELFEREEMRYRRIFHYPPYTRMVQLLLRDTHRQRAQATMDGIARELERHPLAAGVRISGPAPAPFERLRGKWRFQLLLRGTSGRRLRDLLREALPDSVPGDLAVDVDPHELL
ncbi:MAG: primosomal protein N' [Thermoanaerobaculia bacterium]